jgi:hypothetical protein
MEKTWRSVDAGIIDVIVGLMITGIGIVCPFAIWNLKTLSGIGIAPSAFLAIIAAAILLSVGLFTIYGGEMAMKRRHWGLALAASICASLVVFGLLSVVLIIISKSEFATKSSTENNRVVDHPDKKNEPRIILKHQ